MGGVIDDIAGLGGSSKADKMIKAQGNELDKNRAQWEREMGAVSDQMKAKILEMLGQGPAQPDSPWLQSQKGKIDQQLRWSEEDAKRALLDRVRANPAGMSAQSYAKGLNDMQKTTGRNRVAAMTGAEMTPINSGLAFLGRNTFQPQAMFAPNYQEPDKVGAYKAMGQGAYQVGKSFKNWLGSDNSASGFGDYGNSAEGPTEGYRPEDAITEETFYDNP